MTQFNRNVIAWPPFEPSQPSQQFDPTSFAKAGILPVQARRQRRSPSIRRRTRQRVAGARIVQPRVAPPPACTHIANSLLHDERIPFLPAHGAAFEPLNSAALRKVDSSPQPLLRDRLYKGCP